MMIKTKLAALAAVALATGAAQAAVVGPAQATNFGNSSLIFVAVDTNSNTGLVVDLGMNMSDFTNVSAGNLPQGSWNFAANTSTFAGVTGNEWSAAYTTFKNTQSGGDFLWGVVAGDQATGAVSATNTIEGRGLLATGNPTVANMTAVTTAASTGNALGNFANFLAAAANRGTMTSANNGAAATTSADGSAWLPTLMGDKFGGQLTWSYLVGGATVSNFQWQKNLVANPVILQLGNPTTSDSLSGSPLTFSFDIASGALVAAVPEPGTYAMLLAGLASLGFIARRRRA